MLPERLKELQLPNSILLIPDGNRRWASQHGVSILDGYKKGTEALRKILSNLRVLPAIRTIIIWALSPDNAVKRDPKEVECLNKLMAEYVQLVTPEIDEGNGRLIHLGTTKGLPFSLIKSLTVAQERTICNSGQTVALAINYSGEQEILTGCQIVAEEARRNGVFKPNWNHFEKLIDPDGIGRIDLVIRTGGEQRVSGFGWRADRAEFYFTPTLIPDFSDGDLTQALTDYSKRDKRLGK